MSRLKMILVLTALPMSVPALAQDGRTRDDVLTEAFRQVGREASRSVVEIHRNSEMVGHGVVIEDGWIVTTERNVRGGGTFRITTARGRTLPAEVVGWDGWMDIAALRFDAAGASVPSIRRGDPPRVGQWVVSAGTDSTPLSGGVVSATGRDVGAKRKSPGIGFQFLDRTHKTPMRAYKNVIQHDTPLEAGEMGSPLVDLDGGMVGLNVARPHRGTAYSTPIDDILARLDALQAGEKVDPPQDRPGGGDVLDPLREMGKVFEKEIWKYLEDPDLARREFEKRLEEGFGEEGRRLLEMGKLFWRHMDDPDRLRSRMEDLLQEEIEREIGEEAQRYLEGFRDLLEELREGLRGTPPPRPPAPPPPLPKGERGHLGLIPETDPHPQGGVIVEEVLQGSPADRAGIREGDVIIAFAGIEILTSDDLREGMSYARPGSVVRLTCRRLDEGGWSTVEIDVTLGRRP